MTSKRQPSATSKTSAVSFPLRDVIISMERTSQPEGVRFTIRQKADVNCKYPLVVVAGRIGYVESGIMLSLDWSGDVIALATELHMAGSGRVQLVIAPPTSK